MSQEPSRLIVVRSAGEIIEQRACRSVRLPDGREGVVWRGLAHPIAEDGSIDALGETVSPSLCGGIVPQQSVPIALIAGAEEAYLVFAGDSRVCDRLAQAMRARSVTVLRVGRYLGDPMDGLAPDWFIRVAQPATPGVLESFVREQSGPDVADVTPAATPEAVRIPLLEAEVAAARAREESLRRAVDDLRVRLRREDALAAEVELLTRALADEQVKRQAAEAAILASDPPPAPAPAPAGRASRLAQEIGTVFATLLTGIDLMRDSATVIALEYRDRRAIYRALASLDRGDNVPAEWKSLRGLPGWWERHIATGESDAGRLYARRGEDQRWKVLVSHKGQQGRDIDWLRGAGRR